MSDREIEKYTKELESASLSVKLLEEQIQDKEA